MNENALKKVCKKCGIEKSTDQFYFRKDQNRHLNICLLCNKNDNKTYYSNNKEQILGRQNNYYIENKESRLDYQNQYYLDNRTDIAAYKKEFNLQNPEKVEKRNKAYYDDNRDDILLQKKQYRQNNAPAILATHLIYKKQKRLTDPSFKLREDVSRMIFQGLKKAGASKNGSSCLEHLTYSFIELSNY